MASRSEPLETPGLFMRWPRDHGQRSDAHGTKYLTGRPTAPNGQSREGSGATSTMCTNTSKPNDISPHASMLASSHRIAPRVSQKYNGTQRIWRALPLAP